MDKPIATFEGIDAIATLYADRIVLVSKRKSVLWGTGLLGEKSFLLDSISSVQVRKATYFTNGFIQFQIPGDFGDRRTGLLNAVQDENAVMFRITGDGNFRAELFQEAVEDAIRAQRSKPNLSSSSTTSSVADELKKLAELKDLGVLSEDEFACQKSKLLGR